MRSRLVFSALAITGLAVACGRGGIDDTAFLDDPLSGSGAAGSTSAAGAGSPTGPTGPTGPTSGTSTVTTAVSSVGSGMGPGSTGSMGSTSTGMSTSTGGGEVCPSYNDSCTSCISTTCNEIWCDCAKNQDCLDLIQCYGVCNGNEACNDGCLQQYPAGIADVLLVSGCAGTDCDAFCGWGNPDFDECQECLYGDCKDETNECLTDPVCLELWQCFIDCPTAGLSCQQACYDAHGAGVPKLEALFQCSVDTCDEECPGG